MNAVVQPIAPSWSERTFEEWFKANPVLPGGERLLVVRTHRAATREVDLVALDSVGRLVLVEVKNEASARRTIGQALEYLALYERITKEALEELFEREDMSIGDAFRAAFNADLVAVSAERRVVLVAPQFHWASVVSSHFLRRSLSVGNAGLGVTLLIARPTAAGFEVAEETTAFSWLSAIGARGAALTAYDEVLVVVEAGAHPVAWRVGTTRGGALTPATGTTKNYGSLLLGDCPVLPCALPAEVDLAGHGDVWQLTQNQREVARQLGTVGDKVVWVRFTRDGQLKFVEFRPMEMRDRTWRRSAHALPSWRECAQRLPDLNPARRRVLA